MKKENDELQTKNDFLEKKLNETLKQKLTLTIKNRKSNEETIKV